MLNNLFGRICIPLLAAFLLSCPTGFGADDVLTQRYDNARTGVHIQPGLNPSSFAPGNRWGLLASLSVDAAIYAQPLYVSGLMMPDKHAHNIVYVATARNTVSLAN